MSEILFIVPCSARKHPALKSGAMAAQDAYTGQAFRICQRILRQQRRKWCILSAHYGFIWPSTLIEWYEQKMEPVTPGTVWEDCFQHITNRQYARLRTSRPLIVLGSRLYAQAAATLLHQTVFAPVAGLPIGKMLSRLAAGDWLQISQRPPSMAGVWLRPLASSR